MAYIYYNPNPNHHDSAGDCVVRAISKVLDQSWDKTYIELCIEGYLQKSFGDSNAVWDSYLRGCGFVRRVIPNTCPNCYTVDDFCNDHPYGKYILAMGDHTVAVVSGNHYDSWDSGMEVPIYYYSR